MSPARAASPAPAASAWPRHRPGSRPAIDAHAQCVALRLAAARPGGVDLPSRQVAGWHMVADFVRHDISLRELPRRTALALKPFVNRRSM